MSFYVLQINMFTYYVSNIQGGSRHGVHMPPITTTTGTRPLEQKMKRVNVQYMDKWIIISISTRVHCTFVFLPGVH